VATTKIKYLTVSERAALSRDALAEAKAAVDARRSALASAEEKVQEIELAWNRGDETLTAADLMAAQADVTRCGGLLAAAHNEVRRAERNLINDDAGLAETVLPALDKILPGVPVEVHTVKPETAPETLPVLRVMQTKESVRDKIGGYMSGDLEVVGYFPTWTAGVSLLDSEELTNALTDSGVRMHELGVRTQIEKTGGAVLHRASVPVRFATEAVPVIGGNPNHNNVSYFAQALAGEVRQSSWRYTTGAFGFSSKAENHEVTKVSVDDKGVRRIEARFTVTTKPVGVSNADTRNDAAKAAQRVLSDLGGRFATGLGRVETARVATGEGGAQIVNVVFVSRTS
jgi:hypothetical protein